MGIHIHKKIYRFLLPDSAAVHFPFTIVSLSGRSWIPLAEDPPNVLCLFTHNRTHGYEFFSSVFVMDSESNPEYYAGTVSDTDYRII